MFVKCNDNGSSKERLDNFVILILHWRVWNFNYYVLNITSSLVNVTSFLSLARTFQWLFDVRNKLITITCSLDHSAADRFCTETDFLSRLALRSCGCGDGHHTSLESKNNKWISIYGNMCFWNNFDFLKVFWSPSPSIAPKKFFSFFPGWNDSVKTEEKLNCW